MKKLILTLFILVVAISLAGCAPVEKKDVAESVENAETESQFERVLLKKGSLILKP